MTDPCSKCGFKLSSQWQFCPQCGEAVPSKPAEPATPPAHEKAPIQGAFSGLLFGLILVPACIIVGTMLCMTGLGAFLGIPLIILGILSPVLGPIIGFREPRGSCPWCGTEVSNIVNAPAFDCHVCNGKIAVQNRKFVRAA
jgi:DNA-directed RNA polymerase subunit RPC12/RpoP